MACENLGANFMRYVVIPKNIINSCLMVGTGKSLIIVHHLGLEERSLWEIILPKYCNLGTEI